MGSRRYTGPVALLLACLVLSGCGGGRQHGFEAAPDHFPDRFSVGPMQCAPYARARTGLRLSGDAAAWWAQAAGRYQRVSYPAIGAVLVLRATRRMPHGHVAIVRRVVSSTRVIVEQANWIPGRIEDGVPVEDVSPRNDWTGVRVWWAPIRAMGKRVNPAYGFILP